MRGGTGDDALFGGAGRDNFLFASGDGTDVIEGFDYSSAGDRIVFDLDGITSFDEMLARAQQQEGGVLLDLGNGDEIFLKGTQLAALDRDSFTFF